MPATSKWRWVNSGAGRAVIFGRALLVDVFAATRVLVLRFPAATFLAAIYPAVRGEFDSIVADRRTLVFVRTLIDLLADRPLLLLFLVAGLGFPLGRLKIGGAPLGSAMLLFVGLAVGALDPRLKLPDLIPTFGLTLFIYCVGLTSAAGLPQAFGKDGLKATGLAIAGILAAAMVVFVGFRGFGVGGIGGATVFSGALTNSSGLASSVDAIQSHGGSAQDIATLVLAYSLAYPGGIVLPLMLIAILPKAMRIDLREEAKTLPEYRRAQEKIGVGTVLVSEGAGMTVAEARAKIGAGITFGRIAHDDRHEIAAADARFKNGDRVTVVGGQGAIDRAAALLGELTEEHLERDREEFELRRVFVSNVEVAGRPLRDLNLPRQYGAIATRLKRGDLEWIPDGGTILQLGDRVRMLARHEDHPKLARWLGDSYRALSEADLLPLFLGLLLGVLIGEIPIPLPGGSLLRLGSSGGPLLFALILGRVQRTGSVVWQLPYSANLTLRNLGLSLFAIGVGLRAGYGFWSTLKQGEGLAIVLVGALATVATGLVIIVGGRLVLKSSLNRLLGVYAGTQTQPIVLNFATARAGNDIPATDYATVFPVAVVAKILVAQTLLALLSR